MRTRVDRCHRERPRGRRDHAALPLLAGVALIVPILLLAGCGTRTIKKKIYERDSVQVFLRHKLENGAVVERSFLHPASVSKQRLMHILGALDVETSDGEGAATRVRRVAIAPELLEPMARAISAALEEANSDQELAVMAVRKQRRLGLFHRKYLTSLVTFIRDQRLYVHLSRIEWEIPKDRESKPLPEPRIGEKQMPFRAVPGRKMTQAGSQGVAVRWRDTLFAAPVRAMAKPGEEVERRTILMDSTIPLDERDPDSVGIDGVDPETLRALADLEEARRSGSLTETEYQQRRETLLGPGR